MHYFQLHIGDYDRDTAALSLVEHGAYGKLMRSYYATERPLPADPESLWRICGAMTRAEKMAVGLVTERFFQMTADGLRHKRIDAEISNYHAQLETASRAGKASGESRRRKTNARSTTVPTESERPLNDRCVSVGTESERTPQRNINGTSTNHDPVTNNQIERESGREPESVEEWIETIREAYPRKGSQQDCRYAIRTAIDAAHQTPAQILADVKACVKWIKILEPDADTACAWVPTAPKFFLERQWTDPKKFQAMTVKRQEVKHANQTPKRRDSGDLNSDDRYA
jgi:uncharacterized protein YdaU (DUF1376 family)